MALTPQEEAKEIYDSFSSVILFRIDDVVQPLPNSCAKQCGRVLISKILDALYKHDDPNRIDHYLAVREEFSKL